MFKKKLIGVLFAVAALAATSGTFASAALAGEVFTLSKVACTGGTFKNLCYETGSKEKLELEGKQTIEVSLVGVGHFLVKTAFINIKCTAVVVGKGGGLITQTSPLKENGKVSGNLKFSGCILVGEAPTGATEAELKKYEEVAAKCVVPTEKETVELSGELTSESILLLKPASGKTFIEVEFSNKGSETCGLKGNHAIKGEQELEILEPGVATETKEAKAKVESKLKFGEEVANLEGVLLVTFPGLNDKLYDSVVA